MRAFDSKVGERGDGIMASLHEKMNHSSSSRKQWWEQGWSIASQCIRTCMG